MGLIPLMEDGLYIDLAGKLSQEGSRNSGICSGFV